MKKMLSGKIEPTKEQLQQLQSYPENTPITMLNILKFRGQTQHGESGKDTYQRYFDNASAFVKKAGGRLVWKGQVHSVVIGNTIQIPDVVFLVEYPSVSAFMEMISQPAYQKIASDRSVSLEYGGLIACQQTHPISVKK